MRPTDEIAAPPPRLATDGSFEGLYQSEYAAMVRMAALLVGAGGQAEEVVQDAFARVYERWSQLERPGAYLRTAVVNRARDILRRRQLALRRPPDRRAEAYELHDGLADALASLAPKRRAAVVLRYYADLPEAEIAAALGVRPGTVKSMLHRSLAQLREVVER